MKRVVTFGVYDFFHIGHLRLFKRARACGDYLIVAIQRTEDIHTNKPEAEIYYSLEQRVELVESLKIVDEVIPYSKVEDDIKNIDFDVFVMGSDQILNPHFVAAAEWCKALGKEVVVLERTPNVSSTSIKGSVKSLK